MESSRFVTMFILFLFFFIHLTSCDSDSINILSDKILLNCGSSESSPFNGVNWIGDIGTTFLPPSYETLLLSNINKVAPKIPYSTARIIPHSSFTYSFPFSSSGLKFIRLYFLSTTYLPIYPSNSNSYFSVKSGAYTLVNNFNPLLAAQEINSPYITKDFFVNIKEKKLNITFTPSPQIPKAFAFINGIETFSVPNNLFSRHASNSNVSVPYLGQKERFFINNEYAFEKLYMVHMGNGVNPDVKNEFGSWQDDKNYISGSQYGTVLVLRDGRVNMNDSFLNSNDYNYSAPENLYWSARTMSSSSENLTWSFSVDSGFKYLVRLHFCEISMLVTDINQRVFSVYINNQTAEEKFDLVALVGEPLSPLYRDYVVRVPIETERRKVFLLISLHPNLESKPKYADAILNGVEISKLSDSNYNLASSFQLKNEELHKKKKKFPIFIVVGASTLGSILGLFITFFILRRKEWRNIKIGTFQVHTLNSTATSEEKVISVFSGRGAVNPMAMEDENEKVGLVEWAMHCYQSGTIDSLVDSSLERKISLECLKDFVEIGIQCLANKSAERPTMGEVLSSLEKILSLQKSLEGQEINAVEMDM
ncbi:hypothetical protein P8452_17379 [Trifolium repens]|nr:hypothetical protein P8452_17379 [Trifolium repens]